MKPHPLLLTLACLLWAAASLHAQNAPPKPPLAPIVASPVEVFRRLLATNDTGREHFLAGKTPEARRVIETKLREYTVLPAEERDAKLRELHVRWQVQQLIRLKAPERSQQLALIPEPDRGVVAQCIGRISILPPLLQQAVLTNPVAIAMIVQNPLPRGSIDPRREQQLSRLNEFVEMRRSERERVLEKLTGREQEQMQKTLSTFVNLSQTERQEAIQGFKKFAELSDGERSAFLSAAQRWREMSEKDREFWRKIVMALQRSHLPPPMPSAALPSGVGPHVATN